MYSECSSLLRNPASERKWADESGEDAGAGLKVLAVFLALGLASVVTVAMPFALLHIR